MLVRDLMQWLSTAPMDAEVCVAVPTGDHSDEDGRAVTPVALVEQLAGKRAPDDGPKVPRRAPRYLLGPGDTLVVIR